MLEQDKISKVSNSLHTQMFVRSNQTKDITLSAQQQKTAVLGFLQWLNDYQNVKELSPIGKNPIVRYNYSTQQFNTPSSFKTVRLDCQGKTPYCRFYMQQDQVKGKTNIGQIYIEEKLNKLMQLNENEKDRKESQLWRGRVQNILLEFRNYVNSRIIEEKCVSVAVRISLAK